MADETGMTVIGMEALQARLAGFTDALTEAVQETEPLAASLLFADSGGGHPFYPPETEHNQPPAPFYGRYQGQFDASGKLVQYSEQMGERFESFATQREMHFLNTASYSQKVIGFAQTPFFASLGWQTLYNVAGNIIGGVTAWLGRKLMEAWRKK